MDNVEDFRHAGHARSRSCSGGCKQLEAENEKLKTDLAAARKAEKDAGDSQGAVERLEREQETVRERLEKLIQRSRRPTKRSRNAAGG